MGLFDILKNIVATSASNAIDDAISKVKEEVSDAVKEKAEGAIMDGVKGCLNNIEEKVTTEEGKEAIGILQDLVEDAENAKKTAIGDLDDNIDYTAKAQDDFIKLAELVDKHNNEQNQ